MLFTGGPARRVFLRALCGAVLIGPSLGVATMLLIGHLTSRNLAPDMLPRLGSTILLWLAGAAPVTIPGGLLGASLAVWIGRRKTTQRSRAWWASTGALAGAALATALTGGYFLILKSNAFRAGLTVPVVCFLGMVIGAAIGWTGHKDLEKLRE